MAQNNNWITQPDCCDVCVYTVWDSADDYNTIAAHVGSDGRVDCCTIYTSRLCGLCGGLCFLQSKGTDLKIKYEQKHELNHQENDCCISWCAPESLWKQILKEHQARFHAPMAATSEGAMERK